MRGSGGVPRKRRAQDTDGRGISRKGAPDGAMPFLVKWRRSRCVTTIICVSNQNTKSLLEILAIRRGADTPRILSASIRREGGRNLIAKNWRAVPQLFEQISMFGVLLGHGNVFMPKTTNLKAESYCWNLFIIVNSPKHSRDSR